MGAGISNDDGEWLILIGTTFALLIFIHLAIRYLKNLKSSDNGSGTTTSSGESFEAFLESLGIKDHWESKVSLVDAMTIRDPKSMSDNRLINIFIAKVTSYDYRVYNLGHILSEEGKDTTLNRDNDLSNKGISGTREESEDALNWLNEDNDTEDDSEQKKIQNARDILYGILSCLDPFLLQETLMKLAACQIAVPVLMPQHKDNKVIFLLWGLRKVTKTWHSEKESLVQTKPVVSHPFLVVTALRIGGIGLSKSNVLNKLLGPTQGNDEHAFFISSEQSASVASWSQGLLECIWFTPNSDGDKNQISIPLALFNLRGDCLEFEKQAEFSRHASAVTIIFANSTSIQTHSKVIQKFKNDSYVILVRCPNPGAFTSERGVKHRELSRSWVTSINAEGITALDISKRISLALKKVILCSDSHKQFVLEDASGICKSLNIDIDEHLPVCSSSKEAAQDLIELVKKGSKSKFFTYQTLWKKWTKIDKESILEQPGKNIEEKISAKNEKKNKLRYQQAQLKPSEVVENFLKIVSSADKTQRKFALMWTQIFLNELSSFTLKPLVARLTRISQQKRTKSSEINKLKLSLEVEEDEKIKIRSKSRLHTLEKEENSLIEDEKNLISDFESHSIGLEHFIRELGQIAESHVYTKKKESTPILYRQNLPKLAAELLLEGFPVEVLDGDANYVPVSWVRAIIDALVEIIGKNAKVYVISVLGIQSSGKSTLLNSMFGVRFAVSAGRCTRGAFLQLIAVHDSMQEYLKCDYIAIVDTEGLQAPERLVSSVSLEHDNELATFALCIADLTLINIGGQTMGEGMTNILEIAAHAFIRMKEVELSSECRIVQQFVADLTAEEKNETAMQGIFIKLDEAIRNAAKDEGKQNKYRQFSDVFTVQNYSSDSKNVQYIPNLWRGLMSAPDYQYSVKIQLLKSALLSSISRKHGTNLTLTEFSQRMSDVWTAIKKENFVFSFHNTKEVSLYEEFMLMYRSWIQDIRISLMERQGEIRLQIENATRGKSAKIQDESLSEINKFIDKECEKVQDEIGASLKAERYIPVNKHSFYFFSDLDAFKLDMKSNIRRQLDSFSELNRNRERKTVEISSLREELHNKVFQVAEVFKHTLENVAINSKDDVNKTIDKKFEQLWDEWMLEKRRQYELRSIADIKESLKDSIISTIKKDCRRMKVDKHVQDHLDKPLDTFASSTDNVKSVKDVENLAMLFNDFDSSLNTSFKNIHTEINNISVEHANFRSNVFKVSKICQDFVSKPEIIAKNAIADLIFAVFLTLTHHYQCDTEMSQFLQCEDQLKAFAKDKGIIERREIKKLIQSALYSEFTTQYPSKKENKSLIQALQNPTNLETQPALAVDESGMISIVSGFVTDVANKLVNLKQWLESVQQSLPREFQKIKDQCKSKVCTKQCVGIFAKKVVQLCNKNSLFWKSKYETLSFALTWGSTKFEKCFDEALKEHISASDYEMQFAQPVYASTMKQKIATMLEVFNSKGFSQFGYLGNVLTPLNLEKYRNLPFDVGVLQCLDHKFVEMLPTNDTKSLEIIHYEVKAQKKSLLSEKQYLAPFNPSTLSKHITEIINIKEDDKFTNDLKSLAIVHISAWILPVCCVLLYEYEKSKNLANLLEKEKPMMHVHFRSLCSESQDKLIAETFCNIVKTAILDGINHKICPLLFKEFVDKHKPFKSKRVFIGSVFKDLCEKDDFQGIVDFLKQFKDSSENWILNYLSTHCNQKNQSLLKIKMHNCIDQLVEDVHSCVNETEEQFQDSEQNLSNWLEMFSQNFLQSTGLSCKEEQMNRLQTYLNVDKHELFVNECHKLFNSFGESLKKESHLPQKGDVTSTKKFLIDLPTHVHVELFDSLKGCTSQCPFCGSVCDDSLAEHEKHATSSHFPEGIEGRRWSDSEKLAVTICTSAVLSDDIYFCTSKNDWRPYKEYQTDHPKWFIRGVDEQEPTEFWKYIFATFNNDCAIRYNAVPADIPSGWKDITKDEALSSVASAYNL